MPPLEPDMFNGARILVAPLDWGLGHATRCIPIIRRLKELGAIPVIGADGGPFELLQQDLPGEEYVRLPGTRIRYSAGRGFGWIMAKQFPAMIRGVRREHEVLQDLQRTLRLDAVISDQRFGLRSPDLPCVLITHQVNPFTPIATRALRRLNHGWIERFDRCWVMDHPKAPGLAGELSHGEKLPSNVRYIGPQSRLRPSRDREEIAGGVVALISGPEPQRAILDHLLTEKLQSIPGEHLVVQGLPGSEKRSRVGRVDVVPHLEPAVLSSVLANAPLIIARSGYSTIMDLAALNSTALLIPTPGQPEQEYLGRLHQGSGRFLVQDQGSIDIEAALASLRDTKRPIPSSGATLLNESMRDLAHLLR